MDIPENNQQADLVYKNTPQRDLMLTFLPPLEEKFLRAPVFFLIPGGGWMNEKRYDMLGCMTYATEILRKQGFAAVSIDYRVCPEGVSIFDIITDCFDAVRYLAHYDEVLGIDKSGFYLAGHSAGGHLALMLAYAAPEDFASDYAFREEFHVRAVAAISPPTILYDGDTHSLGELSYLYPQKDTREERERSSPITYVRDGCPPTLLCAGTSDWLVYSNSSEILYRKLQENHVESQLMLSICGGHVFEKIHDTVEPSISWEGMQHGVAEFMLKFCAK